jgi:hypothetical protein
MSQPEHTVDQVWEWGKTNVDEQSLDLLRDFPYPRSVTRGIHGIYNQYAESVTFGLPGPVLLFIGSGSAFFLFLQHFYEVESKLQSLLYTSIVSL